MSRLRVADTDLPGVKTIERLRLGDERGYLERLFCSEELAAAGWLAPIAQINRTFTATRATVRGLHYQQPPHAEMKLVTCLHGEVWDVAVDLRHDSPHFLQWHAEVLSADNRRALLIPEGFAHGFQALSDNVELLYFHSRAHAPSAEAGVHPQDPRVAVAWPLPVTLLSPRDSNHHPLGADFAGVLP